MAKADNSSVFHIDILDADIRAERDQSLPWFLKLTPINAPSRRKMRPAKCSAIIAALAGSIR